MSARQTDGDGDRPLEGLTVLLVEDEPLVAMLVEEMLDEFGATEIRQATSVAQALSLAGEHRIDVAVLDVNLGGELAYPIAARLEAASVPFVFATGYGRRGIPERWADRTVIQKPFSRETLAASLQTALGAPSAGRL